MPECVDLMAETLAALSRGEAVQPVRSVTPIPGGTSLLGVMPGYLRSARLEDSNGSGVLGLKAISVFPGNHGTAFDSHQGVVLLFEPVHGCLRAIVDATAITAIRTAAVSGAATRALARPDADSLAILGAGVQGTAHLEAMRGVRPLRRVRVWSRSAERAKRLAGGAAGGLEIEAVPTPQEAVRGAAIVCATTSAREPVLRGAWLEPGVHVNAVGACVPAARELDTEAIRRARLFVDHRAAALKEAGDLLIPIAEGAVAAEHVQAEIGDVLAGLHPGRRSGDEITVFKSLGLAVEDLSAAARVYAKARGAGAGTEVAIGGAR